MDGGVFSCRGLDAHASNRKRVFRTRRRQHDIIKVAIADAKNIRNYTIASCNER